MDDEIDASLERFATKHEERLLYDISSVPHEVAITHIVPKADPFHFVPARTADSKSFLQEELMATLHQQEPVLSDDSSHSFTPSAPSPLKDRFEPSTYTRESAEAATNIVEPISKSSVAQQECTEILVLIFID